MVGMGLNVDWQSFPPEIAETATACNIAGRSAPRADLLVAWLRALDRRLRVFEAGGPASLHADQIAASATLGRRVRVERAHDVLEGDADTRSPSSDISSVLTDDGGEHTVSAGDVVHLRPTALNRSVAGARDTATRPAACIRRVVAAERGEGEAEDTNPSTQNTPPETIDVWTLNKLADRAGLDVPRTGPSE